MVSPWFSKARHEDRRPFLMARNRIVADIRAWFAARDFIEVDCNAMQVSPGNETHLHAFGTELIQPDGSRDMRYLHTSPEFACKKLLAAGERRIFNLGHVFRNRERTPTHAPEFTMLEWYRAGEDYRQIADDALHIIRLASSAPFAWKGRTADPLANAQWLSVSDAFRTFAGVDLLPTLGNAAALGAISPVAFAKDDSWSDIFSRILSEKVEPHLGNGQVTVLFDYPASEAALARLCPHDPRVAERFELYACGMELANGFGELNDAAEQRRRFNAEMDLKARLYGERYPIDEDLLAALSHMPDASGVALGLDRLIMLATGATHIDQVQWTPFA
jgi:elongation factor P--(R)-beta-lysine ligase